VIRSICVTIVALSLLLTLGSVGVVGAYLRMPSGYYQWIYRVFSRAVLWAGRTPVTVTGLEHIDRDNPQVIASNHQSMWDIWALAANIPVRYHFVAKKELRKIPIFGRAVVAGGNVFIDRGNWPSAVESLKIAGRRLKQEGSTAVVFPEGTRSLTGDMQRFKKGPFIMAIEAGVPIVPVVVDGTFEILPKRGFRLCPQPVTVRFGEPVDASLYTHDDRDALIARVHAQMAEMLGRLRAPEGYSGPKRLTEQVA
jgi:1-acyl-sn-glycerol-3-phosphate acyltransferase